MQWPLLDLYDIQALERDGVNIGRVDDEAQTFMAKQQNFENFANKASANIGCHARERTIAYIGGDDD